MKGSYDEVVIAAKRASDAAAAGRTDPPPAIKLKTGARLPNGATVLEVRNGMILARLEKREGVEYITWKWDGQNPRSTWSGNYYTKLSTAAVDFELRGEGR